jgi:hypothetical protein
MDIDGLDIQTRYLRPLGLNFAARSISDRLNCAEPVLGSRLYAKRHFLQQKPLQSRLERQNPPDRWEGQEDFSDDQARIGSASNSAATGLLIPSRKLASVQICLAAMATPDKSARRK